MQGQKKMYSAFSRFSLFRRTKSYQPIGEGLQRNCSLCCAHSACSLNTERSLWPRGAGDCLHGKGWTGPETQEHNVKPESLNQCQGGERAVQMNAHMTKPAGGRQPVPGVFRTSLASCSSSQHSARSPTNISILNSASLGQSQRLRPECINEGGKTMFEILSSEKRKHYQ